MIFDNQRYQQSGAKHEPLKDGATNFGVVVPHMNYEQQLAVSADGRENLLRNALAGGAVSPAAAGHPSGASSFRVSASK